MVISLKVRKKRKRGSVHEAWTPFSLSVSDVFDGIFGSVLQQNAWCIRNVPVLASRKSLPKRASRRDCFSRESNLAVPHFQLFSRPSLEDLNYEPRGQVTKGDHFFIRRPRLLAREIPVEVGTRVFREVPVRVLTRTGTYSSVSLAQVQL